MTHEPKAMGLNKVETRLDTKSHGVVEAFDIVSVGCFEMYLSWNERKGENEEAERKLGGREEERMRILALPQSHEIGQRGNGLSICCPGKK